jgi:hypothetical protein
MAQIKVGDIYTLVRNPSTIAGVVRAIMGTAITMTWRSDNEEADWENDAIQNYLRGNHWQKVR